MSRTYSPSILVLFRLALVAGVVQVSVPSHAAEAVPAVASRLPDAPVAEIRVEGNRRVDREAVLAAMTTGEGKPLDPGSLRDDVKAIYDLGFFEDVSLLLADEESDRPVVVIRVVEKPAVREIRYEGLKSLDKSDIEEGVQVKPYAILDKGRVEATAKAIEAKYREKGYFLADVDWRLEQVSAENSVDVVFAVTEQRKVSIQAVRFVGNEKISDDELKNSIATREGSFISFLTGFGTYKEDEFALDQMRLQGVYLDRGFVDAKIGKPEVTLSADRAFLYVTIPVEEGEPYDVGEVSLSGDLITEEDRLMSMVGMTAGQRFSRSVMFEDVQRIQDYYRDRGYAYVNVVPLPKVDAEARTLSIGFDISKGEQVYVERIEILGNTRTRDKVIRREMLIGEGELYSGTKLDASRQRVTALGYFETVDVASRPGTDPDDIILEVTVDEKPTGTFQVGAGLSSGEGIIAQAQVSHDNLFGRGQSLSLQLQYSSLRTIFQLQFLEPHFLDTNWTTAFSAFNTRSDYRDFISVRTGGSLTGGYRLTRDLQLYLTYNLENVREEFSTPIPSTLAAGGITSAGKVTLSYDTRNNRLFPSDGQYQTVAVEHAPEWLGSENLFTRYTLVSRFYKPLPWNVVGRVKLELGYITGQRYSLSDRFFLGGIYSLRGYTLRSVAPNVAFPASGDPVAGTRFFPIGGNKQALLNAELEFPLVPALGLKGVAFYDMGNAFGENEQWFQDLQDDVPFGLFHSVGLGVRWFSPIGPLRFEWGIPLTPRPSDRPLVFEFTVGNFF